MGGRSAEVLEGDVLAGDALYDVGAGYEHVARLLDHKDEVRDRRRVHCAPCAGTHDDGDLGHHPGSQHVAVEDVGVAGQGDDAFLDPRPARVVDADYGTSRGDGEVHDLADLLRVHLAQRAAEDREVLGEDADLAPRDLPVAGNDPVPQGLVLLQPEVVGAVHPVAVQLDEGARVEQELDALAGRQLAAFALPLDGLLGGRVRRRLPQLLEPLDLSGGGVFAKPLRLHRGRHSSTQGNGDFSGWALAETHPRRHH